MYTLPRDKVLLLGKWKRWTSAIVWCDNEMSG